MQKLFNTSWRQSHQTKDFSIAAANFVHRRHCAGNGCRRSSQCESMLQDQTRGLVVEQPIASVAVRASPARRRYRQSGRNSSAVVSPGAATRIAFALRWPAGGAGRRQDPALPEQRRDKSLHLCTADCRAGLSSAPPLPGRHAAARPQQAFLFVPRCQGVCRPPARSFIVQFQDIRHFQRSGENDLRLYQCSRK